MRYKDHTELLGFLEGTVFKPLQEQRSGLNGVLKNKWGNSHEESYCLTPGLVKRGFVGLCLRPHQVGIYEVRAGATGQCE